MNHSEQPACWRSGLAPLIRALDRRQALAPLAELLRLLHSHPPSLKDIGPYIRFDETSYTRNIVSESPLYRLLVLCWRPGQISPIHDHSGSSCAVLIVSGTATETRYELNSEGLARPTGTSVYGPGAMFGGQDSDIHALGNRRSDGTGLISLHIYSPPLMHMNRYSPEFSPLALAAVG